MVLNYRFIFGEKWGVFFCSVFYRNLDLVGRRIFIICFAVPRKYSHCECLYLIRGCLLALSYRPISGRSGYFVRPWAKIVKWPMMLCTCGLIEKLTRGICTVCGYHLRKILGDFMSGKFEPWFSWSHSKTIRQGEWDKSWTGTWKMVANKFQ